MKKTLMSTVTVIFAQHFNRSENYDCTEGTSNDQSEPQSREYFSPALRVIVFTEHGSVWSRKGAARPLLLLRLYFYSSRAFQEPLYIRARPLFSRFSEHLNTPTYAKLRAVIEKIFAWHDVSHVLSLAKNIHVSFAENCFPPADYRHFDGDVKRSYSLRSLPSTTSLGTNYVYSDRKILKNLDAE